MIEYYVYVIRTLLVENTKILNGSLPKKFSI
jgi:hypothetical protein